MIGCRPLSDSEFLAVRSSFSGPFEHRDRLLFVLGVCTGFRVSELLSLSVSDVWRHGHPVKKVRVRRCNMKGGGGNGSHRASTNSRSVALSNSVYGDLERALGSLSLFFSIAPDAPLFPSRKSAAALAALSRVQAYRILRRAFERAGLDLTVPGTHTMRKTFANTLYAVFNRDLFKLQKALGHKSPASTVAYLSFDEDELDQAIASAWPSGKEVISYDQA